MSDSEIMAGSIDVDYGNPQVSKISEAIIHPDYYGTENNFNDVCLLTLDKNLTFNANVKKIALNTEDLQPDTKCFVSGWGTLQWQGAVSDTLKYVEVNLWSKDQCKDAFDGYNVQFNDDDLEICAYAKVSTYTGEI